MNRLNETLLAVVDRSINRLPFANALVTMIMEKMVPQINAKAETCPPAGWVVCYSTCGAYLFLCAIQSWPARKDWIAPSPAFCLNPGAQEYCVVGCC